MIGALLVTLASLGSLSPAESCEWNRSELKDEASAWLIYSDPQSMDQNAEGSEVYWLTIDGIELPLPVADYQRVLVAVSDGDMSIVTLSDREQRHQVYLTRMDQDLNRELATPGLMQKWIAGYAITPDDIDCDGPVRLWMNQLMLMQIKGLGFPGGDDQVVHRLPHGWLRTGHSQGRLRAFSTYGMDSGYLLDVQWRLPADHPGLVPAYLKPSTTSGPAAPDALLKLADCIALWSVTCLEELDDLDVGVFTREIDT